MSNRDSTIRTALAILAALALVVAQPPSAIGAEQKHSDHDEHGGDHAKHAYKLRGIVASVNPVSGQALITHEPVESLKWPKTKRSFKAHDPALLKDIKPGMAVDFEIEKMGKDYQIVGIRPVK